MLNPPESVGHRRVAPRSLALGKLLSNTGKVLEVLQQFIRFPAFGFTAMLPLLGAATVTRQLASHQTLGLLGVALAFHGFSYVLNDVIDLPLDRTQSLRAEAPLVRGLIRPGTALAFALLQAPAAFVITAWLGGESSAYLALGAAFVLMAVYDALGKRTTFPPATDLIQGVAWGALVFYGASMASASPTTLTVYLFAFVVVYIVMLNGVHASLRDLANDLARGMRSTAILLGARPRGAGQLAIPRRLRLYAWALQAASVGLLGWPLLQNKLDYQPVARIGTLIALSLLSVRSVRLLARIVSPNNGHAERARAVGAYLFASLSSLIVLFALYLDPAMLAVLLLACLGPLLPARIRRLARPLPRPPVTPATRAKSS